jgi:hypothetical protein
MLMSSALRRWGLALAAFVALGSSAEAAVAAPVLPDNRAYELVSPADTAGLDVMPLEFNTVSELHHPAAAQGDAVAFMTPGGLTGFNVAAGNGFYIARREDSGWRTTYPGPPGTFTGQWFMETLTADASRAVLRVEGANFDPADLDPPGNGSFQDFYVREADGSMTWLGPRGSLPLNSTVSSDRPTFLWRSADGRNVLYQSPRPLEPEAFPPEPGALGVSNGLYVRSTSQTEFVSLLPDGRPVTAVATSSAGAHPGLLSSDGTRVAFVAVFGEPARRRVFVFERGMTTSTEASASRRDAPAAAQDVRLEAAADDLSTLILATTEALTEDDTDATLDLYAYDVGEDALTRISAGSVGDGNGAGCTTSYGVSGCTPSPVAMAVDGSTFLFLSPEVLEDGAVAGEPNLYARRHGETRLVATLAPGDASSASARGSLRASVPARRPVRLTPDGTHMAFESRARLTDYDAAGHAEVYLSDIETDRTLCASCGATGGVDQADGLVQTQRARGFQSYEAGGRNLTADGERVFFSTAERLVEDDLNDAMDVYQFDPATGRTSLLSSGQDPFDSIYIDSSADGTDVFFVTSAVLVPQDRNGSTLKVYDARMGGGFPASPAQRRCEPEACHGGSSAAPEFRPPESELQHDSGNIPAPARLQLSVAAIGRLARARAARTGRLTLTVRVNRTALVSARARARLGGRRPRAVGSARRRFSRPGAGRVTLRLSRAARRTLVRRGALRVTVRVTARGAGPRTVRTTLRARGV